MSKLCGRFRVPKPERRGGCRERRSQNRVAMCNRRDACAKKASERGKFGMQ